MTLGTGIAIAAIWLSVAVCGYVFAPVLLIVAPCAMWTTMAIVAANEGATQR